MNRAFYLQSDPDHNFSFKRRWTQPCWTPAELDRLADHELAHGHHQKAEELAHRAAEMREARS